MFWNRNLATNMPNEEPLKLGQSVWFTGHGGRTPTSILACSPEKDGTHRYFLDLPGFLGWRKREELLTEDEYTALCKKPLKLGQSVWLINGAGTLNTTVRCRITGPEASEWLYVLHLPTCSDMADVEFSRKDLLTDDEHTAL